jgi:hypothetical protein
MAFTVVPLHNIALPAGTVIPFGKFMIKDVPDWLLKEPILKQLSEHDRVSVHDAKQALVSEYKADSYGHPDAEWTGVQQKGIQDLRWHPRSSPTCVYGRSCHRPFASRAGSKR